jgi:hypothetical protein
MYWIDICIYMSIRIVVDGNGLGSFYW